MLTRLTRQTRTLLQGEGTDDGTMARRRGIFTARLLGSLLAVLLLGLLMGGRVFISNQITDLRAEIACLEDQKEFLEAGQADLQAAWNEATSPRTVRRRAESELGLVLPAQPGLALVAVPTDGNGADGLWQRMMDRLGVDGGPLAQAASMEKLTGAMVSLTPRSAMAAEVAGTGTP